MLVQPTHRDRASSPQATAYLALQHPGFIIAAVTNRNRELLPRVFTLTRCGLRRGGLFSATLSIMHRLPFARPPYSEGGLLYVVRTFLTSITRGSIERPASGAKIRNYSLPIAIGKSIAVCHQRINSSHKDYAAHDFNRGILMRTINTTTILMV